MQFCQYLIQSLILNIIGILIFFFCVNGVNFSYEGWRSLYSEPAVGTGFITRVKTSAGIIPTNITLNYSGTSNNGDYNATIKYYDTEHNAFKNYTLLGNPYPGAIKFENFYNDNKDKIYGTVYLWSSNTLIQEQDFINKQTMLLSI